MDLKLTAPLFKMKKFSGVPSKIGEQVTKDKKQATVLREISRAAQDERDNEHNHYIKRNMKLVKEVSKE